MSNTPSSDPFSDSGFINQSSSISPPEIHNLPTPLVPKRQHTFKRIEKRTIDVDTLLEDNRDSLDQPTTDDIKRTLLRRYRIYRIVMTIIHTIDRRYSVQ